MRFLLLTLFFSATLYAQKDTIQLKEVNVYGSFSKKYNTGYQVKVLQDSIFKTALNLQDVLQENANIYFKEYGNGMVSSISLRGSGAQHTAVYFNGIAINSVLNGQTDFNTINTSDFNQIIIKKGAGSTTLGSGAIGGAINLKDQIVFKKLHKFSLFGGFGSYNTQFASTQYSNGNEQFFQKYAVSLERSDNDYPYLNTNQINENGAYKKAFFKTVFGYKINNQKQLQFFATYSDNNRDLSGTLTASSFSKLIDNTTRLLLRYKNTKTQLKQQLDIAFLQEKYQFYLYKTDDDYSFGKANTILSKYKVNYVLNNRIHFYSGLETKLIRAIGSNIDKQKNVQSEIFVLSHFKPIPKLIFNLSVRKGIANNFKIPFIYSVDGSYKWRKKLILKANFSTNYRLPTINDLYWNPGGNPNLKPENNQSYEISVNYGYKNLDIALVGFYTKSKNLIQWQPTISGIWQPINVKKALSRGVELETSYKIKRFNLQFNYSFTKSEDAILHKQLVYVPLHKALANVSYQLKKWQFYFNAQYSGNVFTTVSNSQFVPAYTVLNFRLNRSLKKWHSAIGIKINNLLNSYYEVIAYRPMPNRNYQLFFTIKF
jgi:iron complex outermembrane receptor protein